MWVRVRLLQSHRFPSVLRHLETLMARYVCESGAVNSLRGYEGTATRRLHLSTAADSSIYSHAHFLYIAEYLPIQDATEESRWCRRWGLEVRSVIKKKVEVLKKLGTSVKNLWEYYDTGSSTETKEAEF